MLTRVGKKFRPRPITAALPRRTCQFVWLPAIGKLGGDTMTGAAILIIVVVLVVGVVLPAVWSDKPTRRKAALAVLDRFLRWKSH